MWLFITKNSYLISHNRDKKGIANSEIINCLPKQIENGEDLTKFKIETKSIITTAI